MNTDVVLSVPAFLAAACVVTAVAATRSRHRGPVAIAFGVHVVIGLAILAVAGLYLPDAFTYDRVAREYVAFWNHMQDVPPSFALGKEGWVLILACIYRWFGAAPALGIIFNATLTGLTAAIVMATTVRLGWPSYARTAGLLILMPGFLYSSTLLRESAAWILTALAAWAAAGLITKGGGVGNTLWLIASFAGMLWIRGSVAAPIGGALLVGLLLARRRVPVALFVGLCGALLIGGPLVARTTSLWGRADLEHINASRSQLSEARSGFETTVYSTPVDLVEKLPLTLPRAVLGPYPWELGALPPSATLDWLSWSLLLVWTWRGLLRSRGRSFLLVVVPALSLLAAIGATSGNYGTLVRLRSQAAILLIPLAAAGVRHRRPADPPTGSPTADRHPASVTPGP